MMSIETLQDITEEIADVCGVYGAEQRSLFVSSLRSRILDAVKIEQTLAEAKQEKHWHEFAERMEEVFEKYEQRNFK